MNKAAAAANAAKYAIAVSAAYILIPPIIRISEGLEVSGNFMAQRVIVGLAWFLIVFIGFFVKGLFSKEQHEDISSDTQKGPKKLSKWNFVFVIFAPLALWGFFGEPISNGTLESRYYLGVVFWVVVTIISGRNIWMALRRKPIESTAKN